MWESLLDGLVNVLLFIPRHLFAVWVDILDWAASQIVVTNEAGQEVEAIPYLMAYVSDLLNQVPMLPFIWGYLDINFGVTLIGGVATVLLFLRRVPGF